MLHKTIYLFNMESENIELLTTKELREILKVSKKVLAKLIKSETPPPFLKIGREYRFDKKLFFDWLEDQTVNTKQSNSSHDSVN
jgi:excisionase family DNA binding protein